MTEAARTREVPLLVPALVGCGVLGVVAALAGAPVGH